MTRRLLALLVAAALAGSACSTGASIEPTAAPSVDTATAPPVQPTDTATAPPVQPTDTALPSASAAVATPATTPAVAGPVQPASVGKAILYHLQLASDIAADGTPIGLGNGFPSGTTVVYGLLGWSLAEAGTELKLRLFQGDRFVYETSHVIVNGTAARHGDGQGFVFPLIAEGGFPDDTYSVEVDFNGVPDEVVSFVVGGGSAGDQLLGSGSASGPIPYQDPSEVLVVTRVAALRENLGADTDAVLAAAARVGEVHDLDGSGVTRDTPEKAVPEVQRLLRAGSWKYLLILGNDDAVPFVHVANPVGSSEKSALVDWELPSDWLPSDDPYTDLNQDPSGIPDIPTARIPSSDDAQLLLTQLGDIVPPDGGAFALVNSERKSQAGVVIGAIGSKVGVQLRYSPPSDAASFGADPGARSARYLYILLHGIGVLTNVWSTNTVAWEAANSARPFEGEWVTKESAQADAVTIDANPTSAGIVQVGACYGAWTLDTVQEPTHKTADNSLALHYLKSGARAFVADTHLSYSTLLGPNETPKGRTGFELLFWRGINDGLTPIDAFFKAKQGIGDAIDTLVQAGNIDAAQIALKTLHYMVYLGRP
jgi:hypothetical protein